MQDHERLNQLRVMRDRLDRLDASPERDWMLSEVRRRAVDLESEGRAAPLRPLVRESEAELEPAPEPPPVKRAASRPRPQPPQRVVATPLPVAAPTSAPLPEGLRLCLEEDVVEPRREGGLVPWAGGLRG